MTSRATVRAAAPAGRAGVRALAEGLGRISLVRLYLVLALPVVLFQVFGTPPFQMPDEPRHFMRALQIADGRLLGERRGDGFSGGMLEAAAQEVALAFRPLALDTDRRLDTATLARVAPLRWGTTAKAPAQFENTSIYPPTLYLPASLAIRAGKGLGLTILWTYYLARSAVALAGLGLAALALGTCGPGSTFMFVVLCSPLTLSAFASLSQDGLAVAAGALAVALLSRALASGEAMPVAARALSALALGAVVGTRLPLMPLLAVLALPSLSREARAARAEVAASALCLVPVALGLLCTRAAMIPYRADIGVHPGEQVDFALRHPGQAAFAFWTTLADHGAEFMREMVSVLGWWSGMLPSGFYLYALACALAALVVDALLASNGRVAWLRSASALAAAALAALSVFAAFYAGWTPVGGGVIEGVQGRYFVVPALAALLALPRRAPCHARPWPAPRLARPLVCLVVGVTNLWTVPVTLLSRYYL